MSHVGQAAVEPPRVSEGGFLALMRHRNYALLWTGQLVSQIGDRFHWVAISLWVYAQTGSALSVSYAIMALLVGPAIVGVFAGALVDRLDRRKILIYGDLVRAALVFAIPDLMALGLVWVYVDLLLISIASAFFRPAMFAAIPQSVPKDRLLQANAFFASMDTSTEIFGPALAGLVIAGLGYSAAIYADAFTYLVSALFVSALNLRVLDDGPNNKPRAKDSVIQSIQEGLRYIRRDDIQVALLALLLGGYWLAGLNSLQTPLAKGVLGVTDSQFGWFKSIEGVGFVSASVLLGFFGSRLPRGKTIASAYALWAIIVGAMALSANYGVLLVTGFWGGFANMLVFVNVTTILMVHTPSDKIGRAITARQVVVALMRGVSLLAFGWLADAVGVREAILTMAAISFAGTVTATVGFPALWRYGLETVPLRPAWQMQRIPNTGVLRALTQFLDSHADSEFVISDQRWLNLASLLIIGIGWLVLLTGKPIQALGLAAAISVAALGAMLVRWIIRRLRVPPAGHDRIEGDSVR